MFSTVYTATYSVILRYASTWSSPAAILSSRTRRRGSRSRSHSGIVTIFLFFWIVLERSDHQILRKIWRNGHTSCVYVCNEYYIEIYGDQHAICVCRESQVMQTGLMFRSHTSHNTHTNFSVNRLLTLLLRLFIRFWPVGKLSNSSPPNLLSRTFSSVLPRRILCKSRQIYESYLWLDAYFSFPGLSVRSQAFAYSTGQPTKKCETRAKRAQRSLNRFPV